jgi:hypothetical protein
MPALAFARKLEAPVVVVVQLKVLLHTFSWTGYRIAVSWRAVELSMLLACFQNLGGRRGRHLCAKSSDAQLLQIFPSFLQNTQRAGELH